MILRYQNVGHRALGSASSIGRVIPLDVFQRGSTLLQLSFCRFATIVSWRGYSSYRKVDQFVGKIGEKGNKFLRTFPGEHLRENIIAKVRSRKFLLNRFHPLPLEMTIHRQRTIRSTLYKE